MRSNLSTAYFFAKKQGKHFFIQTAEQEEKQQIQNTHAAEGAEKQQLGRCENADAVFCHQPCGGTGKHRLEKAVAAGGQNGSAFPETMQGAADRKEQAEKPAAQKRCHAIGRHAEPDDGNADAGGKDIVAEKEKLLPQAVQKPMQGGLRIEQGAEKGKRKQHLPQCRAVIDDIADFMRKNGKQRRRPEADDRGKEKGGGNGSADAVILPDGAGFGNFRHERNGCRHQAGGGQKNQGHSHPCQLAVGRESLDGILSMKLQLSGNQEIFDRGKERACNAACGKRQGGG